MLTAMEWVFFSGGRGRPSQRWRSLLSAWFTPISPRRRRRSPLTSSPLPLVEHMRCDTTDYLTVCWLEIGNCLRRCCIYFGSRLWRRAYANLEVGRLMFNHGDDIVVGDRWIRFLRHSFDMWTQRSVGGCQRREQEARRLLFDNWQMQVEGTIGALIPRPLMGYQYICCI